MVTSTLQVSTGAFGTGYFALRVAVEDNGANLVTTANVTGTSPLSGTSHVINTGTANPTFIWQAHASNVVAVTSGHQYRFGCVMQHSNDGTFFGRDAVCQTQFVCQ